MRARSLLLRFIASMLISTALASAAYAATVERPVLLVASADLRNTGYRETVLIAVPVGDGRHMGFILNRPTDASLASVFPERPSQRSRNDSIFLGGPMLSDTLFAVVRADSSPGPQSILLLPQVFVIGDAAGVARVIEHPPSDARYFAGLVAWQEDELDAEIEQGFWSVLDASADVVFRKNPANLWQELSRKAGSTVQPSGKGTWI